MKVFVFKLMIALCLLSYSSLTFGQNSNNYNLNGDWTGTLNQTGGYGQFGLTMKLNQNGDKLTGTSTLTYKTGNTDAYVIFNVSGKIDFKENKFYLNDKSIVDEFGMHDWCKKIYIGSINIENNIITSIAGNWDGDGKNVFEYKILKESWQACPPGTFVIRTTEQDIIYKKKLENERKEAEKKIEEERIAAKIKAEKEQKEADLKFETSIVNSLKKIAIEQNGFQYPSSKSCIKIDSTEIYIPGESRTITKQLDIPWNGSGIPTQTSTVFEPGYYVKKAGMKNVCSTPIVIKGIRKLKSKMGTIYYEDASFQIEPKQTYEYVVKIDENFNPEKAEVGSTHYYLNKLKVQ